MQSGPDSEILLDVSALSALFCISIGESYENCIKFLAESGRSAETRTVFAAVSGDTEHKQLSDMLDEMEDDSEFWSSALVVGLVRAGEQGARLDQAIDLLDRYLKERSLIDSMHLPAIALRLWGRLLSCGVTILPCCAILSEEFSGQLGEAFSRLSDQLREGATIADSLGDVFPSVVIRLIAVGEERGCLDEALFKAADLQEEIALYAH